MEIRLLNTIDADEVSPVKRGANRKGVVLKEEGDAMAVDAEVADILSVPWAHEGAMLDFLRKEGVDETIQKSMIGGLRLLAGASEELPQEVRDLVEKLGSEMYARVNRPLNTSRGDGNGGQLSGTADGAGDAATASGADTTAHASGSDLKGSATAAPTNKTDSAAYDTDTDPDMDDDGVMKDGKEPYGDVTYADPGLQSDGKKRYPLDTEAHIRAANSYINMPKNASKYSASQVSAIKSRISAAMKRIGADVAKEDDLEGRIVSAIRKAMRRKPQSTSGPGNDGDDKEPDDDQDDTAVNKGGTVETHAAVPIKKEDGSWDYSGVPAEAVSFYRDTVEKAEAAEKRLADAEERIAKAEDDKLTRVVVAKAEELKFVGAPDEVAEILKAASENLEPEQVEKLEAVLAAANERIQKGDLFKEHGAKHVVGPDSPGDAWAQIEKMAADLVEKAEGMSEDKAVEIVLKTEAGKRLYEEYSTQQLAAGMGGVV